VCYTTNKKVNAGRRAAPTPEAHFTERRLRVANVTWAEYATGKTGAAVRESGLPPGASGPAVNQPDERMGTGSSP
jgi:hypothetical protein